MPISKTKLKAIENALKKRKRKPGEKLAQASIRKMEKVRWN